MDSGTPVRFVVVGRAPESRLLLRSLAQPGPWRILVFLDHRAESKRCSWLGTWTAEIRTVLLASVLGQVDDVVCLDKNMFIQRLPHQAQSATLHVIAPALTVRLSRLPRFFAWNGIFTQRVKGCGYGNC